MGHGEKLRLGICVRAGVSVERLGESVEGKRLGCSKSPRTKEPWRAEAQHVGPEENPEEAVGEGEYQA